MSKIMVLFIAFIAIALIAGCTSQPVNTGNNGNTPEVNTGGTVNESIGVPSVKVLRIESYNFGFDETPVTINKGDRVRLILSSREGIHGLSMPAFGVDTGSVGPGSEEIVEFTADKSGTYEYFCNTPCGSGHGNMKGLLTIK